MRDFKKFTSAKLRKQIFKDNRYEIITNILYEQRTQKYKIWMDRFDSVIIKSKKVLFTKIEYIHNNPVRKKLSRSVSCSQLTTIPVA